jgi:hypothetical protein
MVKKRVSCIQHSAVLDSGCVAQQPESSLLVDDQRTDHPAHETDDERAA